MRASSASVRRYLLFCACLNDSTLLIAGAAPTRGHRLAVPPVTPCRHYGACTHLCLTPDRPSAAALLARWQRREQTRRETPTANALQDDITGAHMVTDGNTDLGTAAPGTRLTGESTESDLFGPDDVGADGATAHTFPATSDSQTDVNATLLSENAELWLGDEVSDDTPATTETPPTSAEASSKAATERNGPYLTPTVPDTDDDDDELAEAEAVFMTLKAARDESPEGDPTLSEEPLSTEGQDTPDTEEVAQLIQAIREGRQRRRREATEGADHHDTNVSASQKPDDTDLVDASFTFFSRDELEALWAREAQSATSDAEPRASHTPVDDGDPFDSSATLSAEMASVGADLASPTRS